jgi:hypothetical protein
MIDTMVFDLLHDDAERLGPVLAAIRHDELRLVTTHVQEDQIAAISDPVRRKALQRLPRTVVPSSIAVAGVTRTGRARVPPGTPYAELRHNRHFEDRLIAEAAALRSDVLVTEDRRLADEADEDGTTVWSTDELVDFARAALRRHADADGAV